MKTAVKTNNLVKQFKNHRAVDGINLNVPEGTVYGFLGPNGAGKTTTIKMLTGMTEPTSGTIEIFGEKVTLGGLLKRSDIGFLPDVPGFYDWMSAKEYLEFCGDLYNLKPNDKTKKAKELLAMVGLKKSANRKVGTFSRGMKQRLGIAQALINDPKIIFLDEPVSALDPIGRKEVMDIIAKLAGKVTVFFSTHILADVERVCDRVVIIDQGKVVLEDSMEGIKEKGIHHIIEIEVEPNDIDVIATEVEKKNWLKEIKTNGKGLTLDVLDMNEARSALNKIIFEKNILLKKLVVVEPTLEDIFLKVVNQNE